jgi:hypothetical protein
MNATKLQQAIGRLETLFWDLHRNGGPDLEVLAILRLCEESTTDADTPDDGELVRLDEQLPSPTV